MKQVSLFPAYGRKYKTPDAVLRDWNDGKDFQLLRGSPYCSIRDLEQIKSMYSSAYIVYGPDNQYSVKIY
ncbi:hypothetical protein UFOVP273_73 [uncultured Caudovirales phage]|uniref:Uncharacterized protein n=1 Tax=uncultured Caudovirales phage TaxID=2100421 RepID=A0A6J5LIQ3_9CAUD|nr:hypothetical protein UFOVP273_73 [uncultured Caudovirales phage]